MRSVSKRAVLNVAPRAPPLQQRRRGLGFGRLSGPAWSCTADLTLLRRFARNQESDVKHCNSFLAASFLSCVLWGCVTPKTHYMQQFLEIVLPALRG
jgi:hypothetical protein